jgi:hypothetical protein
MSDDLIERLRRTYRKEYAPTGSTVGDISNLLRPFPILATEVLFNPDGTAAADRIEAQAAEIERLEGCLTKANGKAEHFERIWRLSNYEIDRLRNVVDSLIDHIAGMAALTSPATIILDPEALTGKAEQ